MSGPSAPRWTGGSPPMGGHSDSTFASMGCEVRLLISGSPSGRLAPVQEAAVRERAFIESFAHRLSRFEPTSELSELNRDPRAAVSASLLLRAAVRAGLWAAHRSGGLVDPTLVDALEAVGYERSRAAAEPASLIEALAVAPPRRAARPDPRRRWAAIAVDDAGGRVHRPVGVRIDTGGTGKGLAADAVAHRLRGYDRFAVDCGGDVAIGGPGTLRQPFEVEVEHPLSGEVVETLLVAAGGVATSGLNVRVWRRPDGRFAHHLLDPARGEPAWTGLIGATALAPSALEAEILSKAALLSGPTRARRLLAQHGGLIVHDQGDVERVGSLPVRRRLRLALPDPAPDPTGTRAA